ncbi:MAG: SpoIIE family protein phosphatase [Chloroflexi bacterium]|nr:SpoIIE family protein phosphatase [Chloroflexota bacterium]
MALDLYPRIQKGLAATRQNLKDFLESAPPEEKQVCLCDEQQNVAEHLHVIETSLGKIDNKTLGFCEICQGYVDSSLLEMDYTASVCLDHYSEAEMRRLEAELEMSQIVQRALLPQRMPSLAGVELAAFSRPSDIIGGDSFDFFQFRDGTQGLVIADVSGHGVSAGMLMSSLQTALRTMAPDTDSPAEIMQRINRFYIHNINFTTFVTVFLARFDPATGVLNYVNAGHNPPIIYCKRSGETSRLMPTVPAIGLIEEFHPHIASATLSEGDVLLLYTDGITESFNLQREQFGQNRLGELVRQNAHLSPSNMIQTVRQSLSDFGENQRIADDITMIALKMTG